jgi:predicted ATPase
MKRYIVTRAPRAGKTAIVRQLVEEATTDGIALWQAKGIAEPWTRPEFIDAIVSLQPTKELRSASVSDLCSFIIDWSFVPLLWQSTFDVRGRKAS